MDFGNEAVLKIGHLRKIKREFMNLPFQVCKFSTKNKVTTDSTDVFFSSCVQILPLRERWPRFHDTGDVAYSVSDWLILNFLCGFFALDFFVALLLTFFLPCFRHLSAGYVKWLPCPLLTVLWARGLPEQLSCLLRLQKTRNWLLR